MVITSPPEGAFTRIPNAVLRAGTLSLSAIGLYSVLCSLPPRWEPSVKGFERILPDGKTKIRSAVGELEKAGLLIREAGRDDGRFCGAVWTVAPGPGGAAPPSGLPPSEKRTAEERSADPVPQYNNKQYKKEQIKKDQQGGREYEGIIF